MTPSRRAAPAASVHSSASTLHAAQPDVAAPALRGLPARAGRAARLNRYSLPSIARYFQSPRISARCWRCFIAPAEVGAPDSRQDRGGEATDSRRRADSRDARRLPRLRASWLSSPSSRFGTALTLLAAILLGQRATNGTRIPPSSRSIFEQNKSPIVGEALAAVIAGEHHQRVVQASPRASSAASTSPIPSSM